MSLDDRFIALATQESSYFRPIVDAMLHSRKNEGRKYLCAINNVIDWCLSPNRPNEGINIHVIHISNCRSWARELLVRFLIHKVAFTFDNTLINKFRKAALSDMILPAEMSQKEIAKARDRRKYHKAITKHFSDIELPGNQGKSLFLLKEQDITTRNEDRNPWLDSLFTKDIEDSRSNVVVSTDTSDFLESKIRAIENPDDIPNVENIFIFHSPNRGSIVNYYNIDQLKRLNQYGLGVKNCIVFSFSEEPQGLYQIVENTKNRLSTGLLKRTIRSYDEFDGFITFTPEETNYLFNRKNNQRHCIIDCLERSYFTAEVDSILEQIPHNLKYRNALVLSFTDEIQRRFWDEVVKEIPNASAESCADYFNLLQQIWRDNIKAEIDSFLGESRDVAFIVPREIAKDDDKNVLALLIKLFLLTLLKDDQHRICFCALEDVCNGIEAEKIVVLQFRYTDKFYKSYPNSFDPLPLKEHQKALIIVNRLTHNDYYEWNRPRYDRDFNGLLYSLFRKDRLGWSKKHYQRPAVPDIRNFIDEAEADSRDYQTEKCTVQYAGGKTKEYPACERVLYKQNGQYCVAELKDIEMAQEVYLQVLDELVAEVKTLIAQNTETNSSAEKSIRSDRKYGLSGDEIDSRVELWKILLKKKVDERGGEIVYNEIGASNVEISFNGFKRWYDLDNPMILPRSRKSQHALLSFLGFAIGSPYHRIVLKKKLFSIVNSRTLNSQIATLLQDILTNDITTHLFEKLLETHSDILTLLDITSEGDVEALVGLLNIDLKPAIRIDHDPN